MKIVIYHEDKTVFEVVEGITSPIVDGNSVFWEESSLQGIGLPFILIEDDVEVQEVITDEVIAQDKKDNYKKVDVHQENKELKERLETAEAALIMIMDLM